MFRFAAVILLCVCAAPAFGATAYFDAACQDLQGNPLDGTYIRAFADNSLGTANLTGVAFLPIAHNSVAMYDLSMRFDDPRNPWLHARADEFELECATAWFQSGIRTSDGALLPRFTIEYHEGHANWNPYDPDGFAWRPEWSEELRRVIWDGLHNQYTLAAGVVPAGAVWDFTYRMADGVDLFSVAESDYTADGVTTRLYDADMRPQSIPEPTSLLVLAVGALLLRRRR